MTPSNGFWKSSTAMTWPQICSSMRRRHGLLGCFVSLAACSIYLSINMSLSVQLLVRYSLYVQHQGSSSATASVDPRSSSNPLRLHAHTQPQHTHTSYQAGCGWIFQLELQLVSPACNLCLIRTPDAPVPPH